MLNADASPLFEEKIELVASMVQTIVHGRGDIPLFLLVIKRRCFRSFKVKSNLYQVMHHLAAVKPVENATVNLRGQQNFKQIATLLYVTSDLSEELLHSIASEVKSCICFVVAEQPPILSELTQQYKQIQIVHVNPDDYYHLFTEVMKP